MTWYFIKLLVLLPLVGGMAYGALWLWRKYQPGLLGAHADRAIRIVEMMPMGTSGKLAVIEFDGQRLLLSVTRGRIDRIAEGSRPQATSGDWRAR
ncbi:MAG TPA: flagellar biosynthetic protein FliO [Sphingobium sp.]|nr:flagellar biosynthetic protein FliO [Sphingobium sp.]